MKTVGRVIGIWMVIAGTELFIFAHMIGPYMDTLSGATLYAVAISSVVLLAVPTAALVAFGIAQASGVITIHVERRKLI